MSLPGGGGGAAGAHEFLAYLIGAAGPVAALADHAAAVGVGVLHGVVVEDLAVFFPIADVPAAEAYRLDWMGLLDPVAHVKVVDVLLVDVVAA